MPELWPGLFGALRIFVPATGAIFDVTQAYGLSRPHRKEGA